MESFASANMKTSDLLRKRLALVFQWYRGMVNAKTGMLEYIYISQVERGIFRNR
jgi:hypothetical protein